MRTRKRSRRKARIIIELRTIMREGVRIRIGIKLKKNKNENYFETRN